MLALASAAELAWADWCIANGDGVVTAKAQAIALIEVQEVSPPEALATISQRGQALVLRSWLEPGLVGKTLEVISASAELRNAERWLVELGDTSGALQLPKHCDWARRGQPTCERLARVDELVQRSQRSTHAVTDAWTAVGAASDFACPNC